MLRSVMAMDTDMVMVTDMVMDIMLLNERKDFDNIWRYRN